MTHKSENRIQQECMIWFHNNYPYLRGMLFHCPNGGARSIQEGTLLKKIGVIAGVADLLFIFQSRVYCFELKTDIGVQSEKQKKWQNSVEKQMVPYHIVRNLETFKVLIKNIIDG